METLGRKLGARLRMFRRAKSLTMKELAGKCRLSPNYIGILERGEKLPALDTLAMIAKILGATPSELLDFGGTADPSAEIRARIAARLKDLPEEDLEKVLLIVEKVFID